MILNNLTITPASVGLGVVSASIASLVSPSVAAGYSLGWVLEEFTISLPLVAVGAAATALSGWPLLDYLVRRTGLVAQGVMQGAICAWIAHFIFHTIRIRKRVHHLVSIPYDAMQCNLSCFGRLMILCFFLSPACLTVGSSGICPL